MLNCVEKQSRPEAHSLKESRKVPSIKGRVDMKGQPAELINVNL